MLVPVSYTHLDVYKRQHLGIVIHAYVLEEEVHELTKNESLALSKS